MTFSENLKSTVYVRLKSQNDFEDFDWIFSEVRIKIDKNISYLCIQPLDTPELVYDRASFKQASLKELNLSKFKRCYRTSAIRSKRENITSFVRNRNINRFLKEYPYRIIMKQGNLINMKKLQIAFCNEADQFYWCQALKNLIEIEKFNKASHITKDYFMPQSTDNELYESFSQKYAYYVTVIPTETSKENNFNGDFLMILKDTEIIFSKEYLRRPNFCIYFRHIRNFSVNEKEILTLQTGTNSTFGRGEIKVSVKNLSIDKAYNDLINFVKSLKDEIEQERKISDKICPMKEISSCYHEHFVGVSGNIVQLLSDNSTKTDFSSSSSSVKDSSNSSSSSTLLSSESDKTRLIQEELRITIDKVQPDMEEEIYSIPFASSKEDSITELKVEESSEKETPF